MPPAFLPTLLVIAFTGQHFHFTHCSVESEVCLLILPLKTDQQTDFDKFISFDDHTQCYGDLTDTDITHSIKLDDQDFDEDDDAESVSSEVSESDKPVPNSLVALNALETLTAYFEAKSSNPDGAYKILLLRSRQLSYTRVTLYYPHAFLNP